MTNNQLTPADRARLRELLAQAPWWYRQDEVEIARLATALLAALEAAERERDKALGDCLAWEKDYRELQADLLAAQRAGKVLEHDRDSWQRHCEQVEQQLAEAVDQHGDADAEIAALEHDYQRDLADLTAWHAVGAALGTDDPAEAARRLAALVEAARMVADLWRAGVYEDERQAEDKLRAALAAIPPGGPAYE